MKENINLENYLNDLLLRKFIFDLSHNEIVLIRNHIIDSINYDKFCTILEKENLPTSLKDMLLSVVLEAEGLVISENLYYLTGIIHELLKIMKWHKVR